MVESLFGKVFGASTCLPRKQSGYDGGAFGDIEPPQFPTGGHRVTAVSFRA